MSIDLSTDNIDSTAIIISTPDPKIQKENAMELIAKVLETEAHKIESHPDFLTVQTETNSIGIDDIKKLIYKIQFKPYQAKKKIAFIESAEMMTTEAQNAFLKTLEEIPSHTVIILTTGNYSYLLPTILSRCKVYEISSTEEISQDFDAEKIVKGNLIEKFKLAETIVGIKDPKQKREAAFNLIKILTDFYRQKMHKDPYNTDAVNNLRLLNNTMTSISKNVNLRLSLENLMINMKDSAY
jgi:replication-associated recombination protein RarA